MGISQTVEQVLATASFYSDGREYIIIRLPASAIMAASGVVAEIGEAFCVLIADKDEVSLIIPNETWEDFANRLPGHVLTEQTYRLITLDAELDMGLVGLMARVSQALADAGVPILPLAAYTRDHILVPTKQFESALAALYKLKSEI